MAADQKNKLERVGVRRALIVELARGKRSQSQLAALYDCSQPAITAFKHRHAEEIKAIQDADMDEFAGLMIASKAARLAVYTELLEKVQQGTPKVAGKDADYVRDPETGRPIIEIDAGAAARVLRNVAEELGHLPTRVQITGDVQVRTNYTVNGVDPDLLK